MLIGSAQQKGKQMKHVYVGQFDAFWKLTSEQWRALCEKASDGSGYDLSEYRELKGRPRFIHRNEDRGGYWTSRHDILYVEPLNWCDDDFVGHIEQELGAAIASGPELSAPKVACSFGISA